MNRMAGVYDKSIVLLVFWQKFFWFFQQQKIFLHRLLTVFCCVFAHLLPLMSTDRVYTIISTLRRHLNKKYRIKANLTIDLTSDCHSVLIFGSHRFNIYSVVHHNWAITHEFQLGSSFLAWGRVRTRMYVIANFHLTKAFTQWQLKTKQKRRTAAAAYINWSGVWAVSIPTLLNWSYRREFGISTVKTE